MLNKKWMWTLLVVVVVIVVIGVSSSKKENTSDIKIGWISDLTGPNSKYGSIQAARIAIDEINQAGGINGRKVSLIEENGKCESVATLGAVRKLIDVDKVKFILGGHCSTETLAAAPVAEKSKIILLASISTSPAISDAGDYIFRTSPVSTQQADLVTEYAINHGIKKFGIVYEEAAYTKPIAEALKKDFEAKGGTVSAYEGYQTELTDLRSVLLKVKGSGADAIFIAANSPDKAGLLLKQIKELKLNIPVFGNEQAGSKATMDISGKEAAEGVIFGEPSFNVEDKLTKAFIDAYDKANGTDGIPYGIWTAESYDAVNILADAIKSAGDNVEGVKSYLYNVRNYIGASGSITINEKGDGVRQYSLKTIKDSKPVVIKDASL
jgi:branched-chain amino acid transport system substrate-binding protein